VVQINVTVARGIFVKVILMVVFSRVEIHCTSHFCLWIFALVFEGMQGFCNCLLVMVVDEKDGGSVLCSDVVSLSVFEFGIVNVKEVSKNMLYGEKFRIEADKHCFCVSCFSSANVIIRGPHG